MKLRALNLEDANLACTRANLMDYKRRIENDVRAAGELFYSA
ncbi:MAG: hypothetical protein SO069_09495 [Succinivibrio sp.]|nr:hypothetical protein [Succinivibrio sp.]